MSLKKVKPSIGVHIDMTPMVDVMMLLVIFFMMSTTFILTNPGMPINLPKASAAANQPENVVVAVGKDGRIAIGDRMLSSLVDLKPLLASAVAKNTVVYVKADEEVQHGKVVEVMDEIRKAGISRMSIAVDIKGR